MVALCQTRLISQVLLASMICITGPPGLWVAIWFFYWQSVILIDAERYVTLHKPNAKIMCLECKELNA